MGLGTSIVMGLLMMAVLLLSVVLVVVTASAQQTTTSTTMYESENFGFRLQIPQGWVIQEEEEAVEDPALEDSQVLAMLCQESEALPGIGGGHNCASAELTDGIYIDRFSNLQDRPEFEDVTTNNITTTDLLALDIQRIQNGTGASQIRIVNETDIINEFKKIVYMTYDYPEDSGTFLPLDDYIINTVSARLYVLSQDRNTGYVLSNDLIATNQTQHTPAVKEVFNTFELIEGEGVS